MLDTAARLLKLLSLLQSRRMRSGPELADALGVTERSVRRDVDRLRSLGYPVHASAGVGGGYQLGAGKELPPLPLDDDEAVAVAVGLRLAATGPIAGLEESAIRALLKLEQVLPTRLRRRIGALQTVSVQLRDAGPTVDAELLSTVAAACRDQELLAFGYQARDGEVTRRTVEPYRLVHTSRRWYLLAWDADRRDWRTFRVDRIAPHPTTSGPFTPRPLPSDDVAAYVGQAIASDPYRYRARVTVHASADEVRARLSALGGHVEPLGPDRCVLSAGADSLDGLVYHLGHLGVDFDVHDPPELIAHLGALADRLARAAGPSWPGPEAPIQAKRSSRLDDRGSE